MLSLTRLATSLDRLESSHKVLLGVAIDTARSLEDDATALIAPLDLI